MGEIIQVHIGQAGVQIANACWELYCLEHGIGADGRLCCEPCDNHYRNFFAYKDNDRVVPRAVLVDSEPTVVDQVRTGPYGQLYCPGSLITGKEDSGSCFARGYYTIGAELIDITMEAIRCVAESCENLRGVLLFRSIGGGTGSGLGNLISEQLYDQYEKVVKMEYVIFPSPSMSPLIVEPYNAMLATHISMDVIDCAFVVDNEALYDICASKLDIMAPKYKNLNRIIGQTVSTFTTSQRFAGSGNISFLEFQTNLVPYPRIHFPILSYSPFTPGKENGYQNFSTEYVTTSCFDQSNHLVRCNLEEGMYMACVLMYRGNISDSSINSCITRLRTSQTVRFVDWSPTGFKIGTNTEPPITVPGGGLGNSNLSLVTLSNNTAIKIPWRRLLLKFKRLYSRRAFMHHYIEEGLDESAMKESYDDISALINAYEEVDKATNGAPSDALTKKFGFSKKSSLSSISEQHEAEPESWNQERHWQRSRQRNCLNCHSGTKSVQSNSSNYSMQPSRLTSGISEGDDSLDISKPRSTNLYREDDAIDSDTPNIESRTEFCFIASDSEIRSKKPSACNCFPKAEKFHHKDYKESAEESNSPNSFKGPIESTERIRSDDMETDNFSMKTRIDAMPEEVVVTISYDTKPEPGVDEESGVAPHNRPPSNDVSSLKDEVDTSYEPNQIRNASSTQTLNTVQSSPPTCKRLSTERRRNYPSGHHGTTSSPHNPHQRVSSRSRGHESHKSHEHGHDDLLQVPKLRLPTRSDESIHSHSKPLSRSLGNIPQSNRTPSKGVKRSKSHEPQQLKISRHRKNYTAEDQLNDSEACRAVEVFETYSRIHPRVLSFDANESQQMTSFSPCPCQCRPCAADEVLKLPPISNYKSDTYSEALVAKDRFSKSYCKRQAPCSVDQNCQKGSKHRCSKCTISAPEIWSNEKSCSCACTTVPSNSISRGRDESCGCHLCCPDPRLTSKNSSKTGIANLLCCQKKSCKGIRCKDPCCPEPCPGCCNSSHSSKKPQSSCHSLSRCKPQDCVPKVVCFKRPKKQSPAKRPCFWCEDDDDVRFVNSDECLVPACCCHSSKHICIRRCHCPKNDDDANEVICAPSAPSSCCYVQEEEVCCCPSSESFFD